MAATVEQMRLQIESESVSLRTELSQLEQDLGRWNAQLRDPAAHVGPSGDESPAVARLADLQDRLRGAERRATEIREQLLTFQHRAADQTEVATALAQFDAVWKVLTPREQCRLIELLVERIDCDGARGKVS